MPSHQDSGIILLAFGGPNSLKDVEPFLRNIFSDRPLSPSLIDQVRERYRLIGGRSPLSEITKRQARALQVSLLKLQRTLEVFVGMRYWHPYIHETLETMMDKGVKKVLCLILSPFSTDATTEGYKDAVQRAIQSLAKKVEIDFVPSWHINPLYLDAVIDRVKEGLALFPLHLQERVQIVFTAHSLPLTVVENDPYVETIKKTISKIMRRLKDHDWCLAFQSRGKSGGAWLSPDVEEVFEALAKSGKKEVLVVPIGFVSDHLETLYDLDILIREKAHKLGLLFHRSPSLNDSPEFIKALTDITITSLHLLSS